MTKTIHFGLRGEDEDDNSYLHLPREQPEALAKIMEAVTDTIEAKFREYNGGDQDKPLCGGCVLNVLIELPKFLIRRGDATYAEGAGVYHVLAEEFANGAVKTISMALKKPDEKVWQEGNVMKVNGEPIEAVAGAVN